MDLLNIETYLRPAELEAVKGWEQGWTWLAGGTWLFSEPQPQLKVLVDMEPLGWSEIELVSIPSLNWEGQEKTVLAIGATCPLKKLIQYPWQAEWAAVQGWKSAVAALAASVKVINLATVGGNLCLALSVGTLAPVMVVLGATYEIWNLSGQRRYVAAKAFQLGARRTVLQPGEVLRRVLIPRSHLTWRIDYQRLGVAASDPALAIVVGAYNPENAQLRFSIGASIPAPCLLSFTTIPTAAEIEALLESQLPLNCFVDNARASAAYRQQMTRNLIERSLTALL